MSGAELRSNITFFGQRCIIACDARCNKAFGTHSRPKSPNSLEEDDYEWLADSELGDAPEISDFIEGDDNKPRDLLEAHNRWCARECERSVIVGLGETAILPDFSQRIQNITK